MSIPEPSASNTRTLKSIKSLLILSAISLALEDVITNLSPGLIGPFISKDLEVVLGNTLELVPPTKLAS